MADRAELIAFLDELLEPEAFDDKGPNGLQVPGTDRVEVVVTGVSAGLELFERAAEAGADLVLCHHGVFWDFQPRALTPPAKRRLEALFAADMSLAAYHLPLDAHPEHGNNALICSALGLERGEPFGMAGGRPIGFVGRSAEGVAADELVERCRGDLRPGALRLARRPRLGPRARRDLGRRALVSPRGRGSGAWTGCSPASRRSTRWPTPARPGCISWPAATTRPRRWACAGSAELLADRFGVEHRFIDVPNPI